MLGTPRHQQAQRHADAARQSAIAPGAGDAAGSVVEYVLAQGLFTQLTGGQGIEKAQELLQRPIAVNRQFRRVQ